MSITVMNKIGDGVEICSGYLHGMQVKDLPEQFHGGDRSFVGGRVTREERENDGDLDSCSCSSIGKNSDDDHDDSEEEEVQSSCKCENGILDAIQALEEALPMRRGMSRFYNGKSKSFASLTDASSIDKIPKPENAYSRRRRNLLACSSLVLDKNKSLQLKSNGGGVSKRSNNTNRTTLALAMAMNYNHHHSIAAAADDHPNPISRFSPFSPWRSFSFADLQQCASAKTSPPR